MTSDEDAATVRAPPVRSAPTSSLVSRTEPASTSWSAPARPSSFRTRPSTTRLPCCTPSPTGDATAKGSRRPGSSPRRLRRRPSAARRQGRRGATGTRTQRSPRSPRRPRSPRPPASKSSRAAPVHQRRHQQRQGRTEPGQRAGSGRRSAGGHDEEAWSRLRTPARLWTSSSSPSVSSWPDR